MVFAGLSQAGLNCAEWPATIGSDGAHVFRLRAVRWAGLSWVGLSWAGCHASSEAGYTFLGWVELVWAELQWAELVCMAGDKQKRCARCSAGLSWGGLSWSGLSWAERPAAISGKKRGAR